MENVPGAVYRCEVDDDWTMLGIGDDIETITGYPASDFIASAGRSFSSIIHPDDRERVHRECSVAVAAGSALRAGVPGARASPAAGAGSSTAASGRSTATATSGSTGSSSTSPSGARPRRRCAKRDAEAARIAELQASRRGSSPPPTTPAAGSSAISTTGRSSGCSSAVLRLNAAERKLPRRRRGHRAAARGARRAGRRARRAARARARHPSRGADRPRPGRRRALARGPLRDPGRSVRRARGAAPARVRGGAVLHGRRGADQRRPVRGARRSPRCDSPAATTGSRLRSWTTAAAAPTPERGSGLRGLEDRLGAVQGELEIDTPPGGGTRLRARVPLA